MTTTSHAAELAVDVRRVVGYRAQCPQCGGGPFRRSHREARADAQGHNEAHRANVVAGSRSLTPVEAVELQRRLGWPDPPELGERVWRTPPAGG